MKKHLLLCMALSAMGSAQANLLNWFGMELSIEPVELTKPSQFINFVTGTKRSAKEVEQKIVAYIARQKKARHTIDRLVTHNDGYFVLSWIDATSGKRKRLIVNEAVMLPHKDTIAKDKNGNYRIKIRYDSLRNLKK